MEASGLFHGLSVRRPSSTVILTYLRIVLQGPLWYAMSTFPYIHTRSHIESVRCVKLLMCVPSTCASYLSLIGI